jgi:DNA-binding XRE family transcriptional regulator
MNIQIIERDGNPEYAVVPFAEFERLREAAETLEEIHIFDQAIQQLAEGDGETFPAEFVQRLLSAPHPLRVWRDYRGFTLTALGKACGVTAAALSQIEKGKREPSASLLKKLAEALRCDMEDLMIS